QTLSSVLFVTKSENKNQVHYGLHLTDACTFVSATPAYAYWKMLEKGANVTESLLSREERAYGIARQEVAGDVVTLTLRGVPHRPIRVRVARGEDGKCTATAETTIAGVIARVFNVHIALGFLHVDHLLLTGWNAAGQVVRERLSS
ncbi:MAG TPA: DUF4833 domain-containing protein, partial [Polyangiaceae bacterium]